MQNKENREAYFITVLCLYNENSTEYFEGRVYGNLSKERSGKKGFGYDPIFIPKIMKFLLQICLPKKKMPSVTEKMLWINFYNF
jgi:inosine/xanthosine triphosphate pyrophosphatase family protein